MVSVVLVDRQGVIQDVFAIPSCSKEDARTIRAYAADLGLDAVVRTTLVVDNATDACAELSAMLDMPTAEHPIYVPDGILVDDNQAPVVEIIRTSAPVLELDWDDDEGGDHARSARAG